MELKLKQGDLLIDFYFINVEFNHMHEDRTNDVNTHSFQYLNLRHIYFWIRGLPGRHARMLLNGHTWKMNKCITETETEMKWFCRYFTEKNSSTYRLDFQ